MTPPSDLRVSWWCILGVSARRKNMDNEGAIDGIVVPSA